MANVRWRQKTLASESAGFYLGAVTPHQRKIRAIVSKLLEWYPKNARDLPWRRTTDPYAVFVSEIMLQQTQVKTVIPYWERWMGTLPNVEALAKARSGKLHKLWEGLGYYSRVRNMRRAAQMILTQHGGRFPSRFEDLLELPGVGPYTAGAICSIAFNQPTPILDGNVIRVLSRLFCIEGDPRRNAVNARLWQIAQDLVCRAAAGERQMGRAAYSRKQRIRGPSGLNQALMELGALICTPRGSRCRSCPLSKVCLARLREKVDEFPQLQPRAGTTARRVMAFVIADKGRVLVRQRPAGVINAHLWEFPTLEVLSRTSGLREAAGVLSGARLEHFRPLCVIKHSITRYRITMEVFTGKLDGEPLDVANGRWVRLGVLGRLPFASAHKKVLGHLQRAGI